MGGDSQPAGVELRKSYFDYLRRNVLPLTIPQANDHFLDAEERSGADNN